MNNNYIPKSVLYANTLLRYGDSKLSNNNRKYYIYYVNKVFITKDLTKFTKELFTLSIFSVKSIDRYYQVFSLNYINNSNFFKTLGSLDCLVSLDDFVNIIDRW